MSKHILERDKFKPENVKSLLIAESPLASGGYFYFDKTTGKDSLFRETVKSLGLYPENERMRKGIDKKDILRKFQAKGFFVIDVCYEPVNNLEPREKKLAINRELQRLIDDIRKLNPRGIVIVKSSIFAPVKEALEKASLSKDTTQETYIISILWQPEEVSTEVKRSDPERKKLGSIRQGIEKGSSQAKTRIIESY